MYIIQVSNYPGRESNSTLPDLPSTPQRTKQSPEPQVAQPQRPPRGLQSPAMQSPPPAYQHQKPTPPKPAAVATSLKTGLPPMIINNPSYRSVSPSPNRSPSPVCDSPSPPPPPAPTSSPPPLYEPPTVPAVVSHTRTRSHSPELFFPPPPSHGTLKRMTSYRR